MLSISKSSHVDQSNASVISLFITLNSSLSFFKYCYFNRFIHGLRLPHKKKVAKFMIEIVVIMQEHATAPYETTDSLQPVINATLELFLLGQEIVRRIICRSDNYNG